MSVPSVSTPSVGTDSTAATRTLAGGEDGGGNAAIAPLPAGGVAGVAAAGAAAGLLGPSAGARGARPLLAARARHALARGSLGQRELELAVRELRQCLVQLAP
ncbi:MAG TPA: hypothetical protein VF250_17240, partial [Conexibacter sp.]